MSRGYTILELLVVVAIIVAISAVVLSNFPQIKSQFSLARVASKFEQDVRRAQEWSLASNQFTDSNGVMHPVKGYGIYVTTSANKQYIIYADSLDLAGANNRQYDPGIDYIVETIDFSLTEPGIITAGSYNNAGAHFNPPNPITTLQSDMVFSGNLDIIFAVESDLGKTKTVSINTTGLVEIK